MRRISAPRLARSATPISSPANVCIFCEHQYLNRVSLQSPLSRSIPSSRRQISLFDAVRKRISPAKRPAPSQSTTPLPSEANPSETVTLGGSETARSDSDLYDAEDAEFEPDDRSYESQLRLEERALYQQSVDEALTHKEYVPAKTWAGLPTIGGETGIDSGREFVGFATRMRGHFHTRDEITMALHRAVVEVLAAQSVRASVKKLPEPQPGVLVTETKNVRLAPSSDGLGAVLEFPNEEVQASVLDYVRRRVSSDNAGISDIPSEMAAAEADSRTPELGNAPEELALDEEIDMDEQISNANYTPSSLSADVKGLGDEWLNMSLADAPTKLAITRRVFQLTGQRIPDNIVQRSTTLRALVRELAKPPPPKRLYESLMLEEHGSRFAGVPNVSVSDRRVTSIDKHREVGRWKVIEHAYREKGLPVYGTDPVRRAG